MPGSREHGVNGDPGIRGRSGWLGDVNLRWDSDAICPHRNRGCAWVQGNFEAFRGHLYGWTGGGEEGGAAASVALARPPARPPARSHFGDPI